LLPRLVEIVWSVFQYAPGAREYSSLLGRGVTPCAGVSAAKGPIGSAAGATCLRFCFRIVPGHHLPCFIQALDFGLFAIHGNGFLNGLTLFNLGEVNLLSYYPSFLNMQYLGYDWHNQGISKPLNRLRAIHYPVRLYSFDLDTAPSKFLLENLVVAFDVLRNSDAARLYRDGVRVQFLLNYRNNYVLWAVHTYREVLAELDRPVTLSQP
jgi:hypothetical protein